MRETGGLVPLEGCREDAAGLDPTIEESSKPADRREMSIGASADAQEL